MQERQHRTFAEGLLTGLVGAIVVAVWYLILDVAHGQPLSTPNVLGQVFVRGDTVPTAHIIPQAVAEFSVLHLIVFLVLGVGLVWLAHLASRNPSLRMGVWLGLVIGFLLFLGHLVMLAMITRQRLPWLTAIGGSILGIGSMALFLWNRHPRLRGSFEEMPLGAEVKPPPHPPGVPRRQP
jgi:uncharacterized membrane protein YgdD (TMEM256/DUF423 family)